MIPNDILLHSVPCLVISREVSSGNRWKQMLRPTARYYVKRESLSGFQHLSQSSPSPNGDRGTSQKMGRKYCTSRMEGKIPWEQGPQSQLRRPHMDSQNPKGQAPRPVWVCSKPSGYIMQQLACCFCGTPNNGSIFISDSFACSSESFPPIELPCPASIQGLLPCLSGFCFVCLVIFFGGLHASDWRMKESRSW